MTIHRALIAAAVATALCAPAAVAGDQANGRGRSAEKSGKQDRKDQQAERRDEELRPRFRGMDRDGDGVITRAEWRGDDRSFAEHDTNRDGVLSGDEVRTRGSADAARDRARRDQLNARFDRADRNRDGRVTREEWRGNAALFTRMDRDGDGSVTREEFAGMADRRARAAGPETVPRNQSPAYRAGYERGLIDGRQAGREDKTINGGKWDLDGQRELEQADAGYRNDLGDRADYQAGYRAGFRLAYGEGFGPRR